MDATEFVQSRWLTAQDIKDSTAKTVVILGPGKTEDATSSKGDKYLALVVPVQIDSKTKDWKINRTSCKKLIEKMGKDTNAWVGKPIVLTTMLMQGGKEAIIPI